MGRGITKATMSNHSGSYLANSILTLLHEYKIYDTLGKAESLHFLKKVREIAHEYDCNAGEVLDVIGAKLGVCYECWEYADDTQSGVCKKCRPTRHH